MRNKMLSCLLAAAVVVPAFGASEAGPGWVRAAGMSSAALGQSESHRATGVNLRVFEGIRETGGTEAMAVTSSYLKYSLSTNIESEDDLAAEAQRIRKVFNLADVKLLTEAALSWSSTGKGEVSHVFRINGKEYAVRVARGGTIRQFLIQVDEQGEKTHSSLLDTTFTIPEKNSAVFGFEDSKGKAYFVLLRVTGVGGVLGGVEGGVEGGVAGGVKGGVARNVRAPKLIKEVEPVYPEDARKAKIEGIVVVEGTTDIYGHVAKVEVLKSVPALEQAAVDALKQWVYEPMLIDGKPQPVVFTVTMRFALDNKAGEVERTETTGIEGGVAGGVSGVVGGVEGGVRGGVSGQEYAAFEKDAVRVLRNLKPPRLGKAVDPVYPIAARQARVQGVVILEVGTDEEGDVKIVKILRSIPLLDQAAVEAVKQWKYEPFLLDGKPRKALFTVTVRFQLEGEPGTEAFEKFGEGAVKAVGDVKPPRMIKTVDPVYPEAARQAGVQGVVILSVRTDTTGKVVDAMVLRSVPLLDQSAIDAVKQWVYEPLVVDGKAQPVVFTVTVRFNLK